MKLLLLKVNLIPLKTRKLNSKEIKTQAAIKKVVYIIECNERKEIYMGSIQTLNTRTSQDRSNIKIEENRKLNVSKHLYQSSRGKSKIMSIYKTNDYTLLQITKKNFIDKSKPKLNKI